MEKEVVCICIRGDMAIWVRKKNILLFKQRTSFSEFVVKKSEDEKLPSKYPLLIYNQY